MESYSKRVARFGVFEADLDARELRKHGLRVKLQDQPFQVLALLLEHPGEIVTREELQKAIWSEDTFVEFDNGISTAVQKIRTVLNDDASSPRFIETVPRRGYRFIAPVQAATDNSTERGMDNPAVSSATREFPTWKLAAGIVLLIVGAYLVIPREPPNPSFNGPPISFSIHPPAGHRFLPAYWGGRIVPSPDGRRLVYAVQARDGTTRLVLRELRSTGAKLLPGTEGGIHPFWSPDGESIGFGADGRLATLRLDGGVVHHVTEAPHFRGGAWSPAGGGVIVFATRFDQSLSRVPASGGSPEPVTTLRDGELSHRWPHFLPDGRRFLYFAQKDDGKHIVRMGSLEREEAGRWEDTLLLRSDSGAQFVPDGTSDHGWLVLVRDGALTRLRFDAVKLLLTGEAETLARGVEPALIDSGAYNFAASASGVLSYRSRPSSFGRNQLTWYDREGRRLGVLGKPASHLYVGVSPDERRVAVISTTRDDSRRNVDIWVYDSTRGAPLRRTFHPDLDRTPIWSPDSRTILFCSNRESSSRMYRIQAMGDDEPQAFFDYAAGEPASDWPTDWSLAGDLVIYARRDGGDLDIWAVDANDQSSANAVVVGPGDQFNGKLSPGGRALAYASDETGQLEIFLQPYPPDGTKLRVSDAGGNEPLWRGDGGELFFLSSDGVLMAVIVRMGTSIELGVPRKLFQTLVPFPPARQAYQYAVSTDGQRFLVLTEVDSPPATVVINWQELAGE